MYGRVPILGEFYPFIEFLFLSRKSYNIRVDGSLRRSIWKLLKTECQIFAIMGKEKNLLWKTYVYMHRLSKTKRNEENNVQHAYNS